MENFIFCAVISVTYAALETETLLPPPLICKHLFLKLTGYLAYMHIMKTFPEYKKMFVYYIQSSY